MHCIKTIHSHGQSIRVMLFPSSDIHLINRSDWESLAIKSKFCNPFFEYWHLEPAVTHLSNSDTPVYIAVLYKEDTMIGLFPITKQHKYKIIPTCSVWQHTHCYLSTPLISKDVNFDQIISIISIHLDCYWSYIPLHDKNLMNNSKSSNVFSFPYNRAAISNTSSIRHHLDQLKGKNKRELYRQKNKLEGLGDIVFIKYPSIHAGLSDYCKLEVKGWKGENGGAILCNSSVNKFYKDIFEKSKNNIDVFGLYIKDELIACTIRLKSRGFFYEIKTTYNENMSKFSPGKTMELYLLEELSFHHGMYIDSCTNQENKFINWLWPDKKYLYISYIFSSKPISIIFNYIYSIKQWLRK